MFPLVHNIDFVIAAICVLLIIYFSVGKKYSKISQSNRMFYNMVNTAMIQSVADIFMNVAETYTDVFSPQVAGWCRTAFNLLTVILTYYAYAYVKAYSVEKETSRKQKILDIVVAVMLISFVLLGIYNLFSGVVSYIDESGAFHNGPLYITNYIVPLILLIFILITAIDRRKYYSNDQFRAIIFFIIMVLAGVAMEFLLHYQTLTIMFGVSLALLIIQLSLETPDYKKMNDTMEALKETNIEVQKAKEAAEYANRAKSDFLARMSHEIRTPINAVLGMNEMIVKESSEDSIREYATDAYQAANNLLSIINDILDFSKVESGKMSLINEPFDTNALLREEYTIFSFKAESKGLALVFDIEKYIPKTLFGDNVRIKQVITNLLNNAMKYTDNGTVTLRVRLTGIEDNATPNGNTVANILFEVIDTGRGIKEEDMSKLFDAFERIDEKNSRNIEGTGLGLNIVKVMLKLMNSELKVESKFGEGSKFYFTLPLEIIDSAPIGAFSVLNSAKEVTVTQKKEEIGYHPELRILSVDDNMINLKVFEGLLKQTGAKIDKASSGFEALDLTKANPYDIIFLDHMMPEMDGVETFKKMREQTDGPNANTPIIVLTANAIKGSEDEYLNIGFNDVCYKPTTQKDLYSALMKWTINKAGTN